MTAALAGYGVKPAVARKVFAAVHGRWVADLDGVAELSAAARAALTAQAELPDVTLIERRRAADGFVKYLFRLPDRAEVEAVRIPLPDPAEARALKQRRRRGETAGLVALPTAKYTVCISSQTGCSIGCAFCATGRMQPQGRVRNLATWEMLAQVHAVAAEADHPVRGVLFLGMGEPLLNYDNVIRAARILSHPAGPAIAAEAISLSTVGVAPAIRRYAAERHPFRLIVSLAAATGAARLELMPVERRWPLGDVMAAVREYAAAAGGRVTLAWVCMGGVNMGREHARQLADLLDGLRAKVTLIDVNDASGRFRPPGPAEVNEFRDELGARGIPVSRRYAGGQEIGAACGTLAATRAGGVVLDPPAVIRHRRRGGGC
jgi:23S rRNA (adenine2503-C2)-methyltransferase